MRRRLPVARPWRAMACRSTLAAVCRSPACGRSSRLSWPASWSALVSAAWLASHAAPTICTKGTNGATTSAASTSCAASIRSIASFSRSFAGWPASTAARFAESLPEIQREIQAAGHAAVLAGGRVSGPHRAHRAAVRRRCVLYLALRRWAPGLIVAAGHVGVGRLAAAPAALPPGRPPAASHQTPHAVSARPADAADGSRLQLPSGPGSGHTGVLTGTRSGVEFGRVLADMRMGKTRTEAFEAMLGRLGDDEMTSIISSIIQGENLGTPLANVFRTQADVLRIKRTPAGRNRRRRGGREHAAAGHLDHGVDGADHHRAVCAELPVILVWRFVTAGGTAPTRAFERMAHQKASTWWPRCTTRLVRTCKCRPRCSGSTPNVPACQNRILIPPQAAPGSEPSRTPGGSDRRSRPDRGQRFRQLVAGARRY